MEITANASQLINVNSNVLFSEEVVPGSHSIFHRDGSGLVILRGLCNGQNRARFRITFSTNIKADSNATITGPTLLSLALAINGEPIETTTMTETVSNVTAIHNIGTSTLIDVPSRCCETISIKNISTIPVETLHANLIVERVA